MRNLWWYLLYWTFKDQWAERCENKAKYNVILAFIIFVTLFIIFIFIILLHG